VLATACAPTTSTPYAVLRFVTPYDGLRFLATYDGLGCITRYDGRGRMPGSVRG